MHTSYVLRTSASMRKYIQAKIRSSGCFSVFSLSLHQVHDPPVSFLWSISGLRRKRQMVPTPYARRGRRGNTLAISMRRNLSYRGGAQEEQGQLRQAHSRVVTGSMQLLRYSLLTPHQCELNLSCTSNSFLVLLYLLGADWGLHQLLRSDEQWNLPQEETWKCFFPHRLQCLPPSCCSGITYAAVRSTYRPASGPFYTSPHRLYAYTTDRYDRAIAA